MWDIFSLLQNCYLRKPVLASVPVETMRVLLVENREFEEHATQLDKNKDIRCDYFVNCVILTFTIIYFYFLITIWNCPRYSLGPYRSSSSLAKRTKIQQDNWTDGRARPLVELRPKRHTRKRLIFIQLHAFLFESVFFHLIFPPNESRKKSFPYTSHTTSR